MSNEMAGFAILTQFPNCFRQFVHGLCQCNLQKRRGRHYQDLEKTLEFLVRRKVDKSCKKLNLFKSENMWIVEAGIRIQFLAS